MQSKEQTTRVNIDGKDNTKAAFASCTSSLEKLAQTAMAKTALFAAGFNHVTAAIAVVGQVIGALARPIMETAKMGEELLKLSEQTGLAVESLDRMRKIAAVAETDFNEFISSVKKFEKALHTEAATSAFAGALQSVGLNLAELKAMKIEDALLKVSERFAGLEKSGQKSALSMQLFGKSGTGVITMLNTLKEDWDKFNASFTQEKAQAAADFNDQLDVLKLRLEDLWLAVGTTAIPALNEFLARLAGAASEGQLRTLNEDINELYKMRERMKEEWESGDNPQIISLRLRMLGLPEYRSDFDKITAELKEKIKQRNEMSKELRAENELRERRRETPKVVAEDAEQKAVESLNKRLREELQKRKMSETEYVRWQAEQNRQAGADKAVVAELTAQQIEDIEWEHFLAGDKQERDAWTQRQAEYLAGVQARERAVQDAVGAEQALDQYKRQAGRISEEELTRRRFEGERKVLEEKLKTVDVQIGQTMEEGKLIPLRQELLSLQRQIAASKEQEAYATVEAQKKDLELLARRREAEIELRLAEMDTAERFHTMDKADIYRERLESLQKLIELEQSKRVDDGAAHYEQLKRIQELRERALEMQQALQEQAGTVSEGIAHGITQYVRSLNTNFQKGVAVAERVTADMERAFGAFFDHTSSGFMKLGDLAVNILNSIANAMMQQFVVQTIVKGISSYVAGAFAGSGSNESSGSSGFHFDAETAHTGKLIRHQGGYIPRFHSGGLNSDERVVINKVGERYITKEQNEWLTNLSRSMQGGGTFIINALDPISFEEYVRRNPGPIVKAVTHDARMLGPARNL